MGYSVLGKRIPDIDGTLKVTGDAKYSGDLILTRMLHGRILRSPHPHAKILRIDTSKAERLIGVKGVIIGKDTPGVKYGVFPRSSDEYALAMDKVRYIGDAVAAVAAIDEDIAGEALDLIQVEYELLRPVFDPLEAMQPYAPKIHDVERNISSRTFFEFGNVEEGFKQSYYVREDCFETVAIAHCQMEPFVALARFDPSGRLEVWTPNQSPFTKRRALSKTLKIPLNNVRVHKAFIGGAFGGRSEMFAVEFCGSLLSKQTERPVKISYTREEVFISTRQKHPMIVEVKTGVKKDGNLLASQMRIIADGGAYNSTGSIAITVPLIFMEAIYRQPNLRYEGIRVYTNKSVRGAMRGHGGQQSGFALGSQLDMIAEELGIDPVDIRLKNCVQPGDILPSSSRITSCGLRESIERTRKEFLWAEKRRGGSRTVPAPHRGLAVGCSPMISGFGLGIRTSSSAFIKFNEDGEAFLTTGLVDNGQGNYTMAAQIAAEELGLSPKEIKLIASDTDACPEDPGTYSMTATFVSGNAVRLAAVDAKKQLFCIASEMLEAPEADLEAKEGRIFVKGSPDKGVPIHQVVWNAFAKGTPILGKGFYMPPVDTINWVKGEVKGQISGAYTFGTTMTEVEVDKETGLVKLKECVVAHDCGLAINPMMVEGQMEGSVAMALGQVLSEELLWDNGQLLNPSFLDFKIPLSLDTPRIKCILVETKDPHGPFGAKEASETTNIALISAIASAIKDATRVRIKSLPITPEKIKERNHQEKLL